MDISSNDLGLSDGVLLCLVDQQVQGGHIDVLYLLAQGNFVV